ncbi:transposase DDE domain protein [bacterium BMS3Abin03]|nr:transposase DDE domain protein [bacterium BMS3Abin03]
MKPQDFFLSPVSISQKQYEALRMFFIDKQPAGDVASKFGYTYRGFTTIVSGFRKQLKTTNTGNLFFTDKRRGRKRTDQVSVAKDIVIELRKKYYSVEDIKVAIDSKGYKLSEKTIYNILSEEGFSRLPRRMKFVKQQLETPSFEAPKSIRLDFCDEEFKSASGGILCFMPYIEKYGIREIIEQSAYPATGTINKLSSILSFVALKSSNTRRYSVDDLWCMDRGLGLFAGLNVLPKAAWFTSYSHRVTPQMNREFLKALHKKWIEHGLLGDTSNLDFTTIPYWGDGEHLENNWSGKRGKALSSILAVLAQDPDTGIINYGDADVRHENESDIVLEFLDFYKQSSNRKDDLKYLVFDSKFTNYQNLKNLDNQDVKFITIRRRGKNLINKIEEFPKSDWRNIRVECAGNKKRSIRVYDQQVYLRGYEGTIRQINITGHGKIKPAIIITNDFGLPLEKIVRKYAKRWIVEKAISEQIEFFHLNKVCSSMVIKVDFDLTMSILTHNIYRLFAMDLERYANLSNLSIYEKFIRNAADIKIEKGKVMVNLKKKRELPLILQTMSKFENLIYHWFDNKNICFSGATYS